MDEMAKLTEKLEYLFLKAIVHGLSDKSTKAPIARQFGIEFLKLEPFTSLEDAKKKMAAFVSQNSKFEQLTKYMNAYHEETRINEVIEKMRTHMKNNDIDKALEVAAKK